MTVIFKTTIHKTDHKCHHPEADTWWFIPISKWVVTPVTSEHCPT